MSLPSPIQWTISTFLIVENERCWKGVTASTLNIFTGRGATWASGGTGLAQDSHGRTETPRRPEPPHPGLYPLQHSSRRLGDTGSLFQTMGHWFHLVLYKELLLPMKFGQILYQRGQKCIEDSHWGKLPPINWFVWSCVRMRYFWKKTVQMQNGEG